MACAGAGAEGAVAQQLQVPQLPAQTCLLNLASLETAEQSWATPPSTTIARASVRARIADIPGQGGLWSGQCTPFTPLGSFSPFSIHPSPSHAIEEQPRGHWGLVSLSTNSRCPNC